MSDPDGRWVNIAIGAGIGAVLGAGIEGWKQVATGDFNAGRLGAAAAGGAVAGGIAGATMGLSLVAEGGAAATVGVVGASSAAGGSTTRALMGEEVSAGTAATDAVVGVATFGVLKGAGAAVGAASKSELVFTSPKNLIPTQTKSEMSGSEIKRLAKDMKANGYDQSKPISAQQNARGRLEISDGHHRREAAIQAGVDKVPVEVSK